ncbi:hypothetical protein [Flexibacterium corallicola]|uniref:hypothetical protein n=1 Tax=Flexibacterium corallicola TaxID=3037259 RepID=UPI00286FA2B6|nr:hypothetical protein [Pseudovibrio sp. M1P-2-3]
MVLIADRGFDGDRIREQWQVNGGTAVIPGRRGHKEQMKIGGFIYALTKWLVIPP